MPVGKTTWPHMYPIEGMSLGVAQAHVRYPDRDDVVLISLNESANVAGVFTQNAFCAAPVTICKKHLANHSIRALVVNSGNANACTGEEGIQAAMHTCSAVANSLNIQPEQVLPFSTGVIGEPLPFEKISGVIPQISKSLNEDFWLEAAQAIMTTDTRPKGASERLDIDGSIYHVTGVSKGSGMINPNMATMLAYIATDANIDSRLLSEIAKEAADKSFNRITIDGDTSTNDAAILIATGKASEPIISDSSSKHYLDIKNAIIRVYQSLAKQIVQDGEGATKCVQVRVTGGLDSSECFKVVYAIAHSPLIKTALFACDPNWGRIVAAIGYAGVPQLDPNIVNIFLDQVQIVEKGQRSTSYSEEAGQMVLDKEEFEIVVDLGRGKISETLWTSDLSHEYIRINAEYRS